MEKFSDNKFQVINMNYKLKKIKNRKKNKKNYKNIEPFEILENIDSNNTIEKEENTTEGFKDSDYDGIDNVKDNKKKTGVSPIDAITDFINKIYNFFIKTNNDIAKKLAMVLSKNKATENDIFIIRQYIAWSESVLAAAYVSYNFFFIMYYKDVDGTQLIEISRKSAQEYKKKLHDEKSLLAFPMTIFLYFFNYSMYFTEVINNFLTKTTVDKQIGVITEEINYTTRFLFIFLFLVIFFKYSAALVKNTLIDAIKFKYTILSGYIFITIVLLWGSDFLPVFNTKILNLSKSTYGFTDLLLFFLNRFIKLIAVLFFGVPMSVLMFVLYIYLYAFGSILYYKNFNISTTYNTIYSINEFIKNSKKKKDTDKNSFMEILGINFIMGVVDFLYSKLILIAFIIIYIIGWFDYYKNISSKSGILKNGLLFINICLIIMFSSIIMQFYILEQRKESTVESVNNNNNNDH
jgi:hypothetical protein